MINDQGQIIGGLAGYHGGFIQPHVTACVFTNRIRNTWHGINNLGAMPMPERYNQLVVRRTFGPAHFTQIPTAGVFAGCGVLGGRPHRCTVMAARHKAGGRAFNTVAFRRPANHIAQTEVICPIVVHRANIIVGPLTQKVHRLHGVAAGVRSGEAILVGTEQGCHVSTTIVHTHDCPHISTCTGPINAAISSAIGQIVTQPL